MSSMFDSQVRDRRDHTPWARVDVQRFMIHAGWNGTDNPLEQGAVLSVHYRPSVASRMWWRLEWTGEDGQRHNVEAQELELLLWRAAEAEMQARARREQQTQGLR